jgi:uncharacterized membrane protein
MDTPAQDAADQTETGRLEAFSDGVFSVAITLLVLGLTVPALTDRERLAHGLTAALLSQWPSYLTYVLSFLTILIMWVNHHALFRVVRRTDQSFLILNGLLLLVVTTFPFATAMLAMYLPQPVLADRRAAMVVYSGLSLVLGLLFNLMWAYAARGGRLLDPHTDPHRVRGTTARYAFGPPLQVAACVLAFLSVPASLTVCILMTAWFIIPARASGSRTPA